jgi:hypothetical protein
LDIDKSVWDTPTFDSPRYCVAEPASAISANETGVATFSQVTLLGSNTAWINLYVIFESGYSPVLVGGVSTLRVLPSVASISVPTGTAGNWTAAERVPITNMPEVVVRDSAGNPLANVVVFAIISEGPFGTAFFQSDTFTSYSPVKSLLGSASLPTGSDGVAHWSGLAFGTEGPAGRWGVRFVAEGITSDQIHFQVQSCVALVLLEVDAPVVEVDNVAIAYLPMFLPFVVRILALDASYQLIEGKTFATSYRFRANDTEAIFQPIEVSPFVCELFPPALFD